MDQPLASPPGQTARDALVPREDPGPPVPPATANDGKRRDRPGRDTTEPLSGKHPGTDALPPHLCRFRLAVVDHDDVVADAAEGHHGPGPPPLPGACPGTRSKVGGGKPCWA